MQLRMQCRGEGAKTAWSAGAALVAMGLMSSCGGGDSQGPVACSALASQALQNTRITLAAVVAASAPAPEHCRVQGAINERVSAVNGQAYAIKFDLRMPTTSWNGRFLYSTQGGIGGNLGTPTGAPLNAGYAVVTTDAGHDNAINTVAGDGEAANFGLDPQARLDYGFNADDQVTQKAKALIRLFYAKDAHHSYMMGCSNGGRAGLVAATRFPTYFDGIVAGAPAINLPRAALAEAYDTQVYANLATTNDATGQPALWTAFTSGDLALVADAVRTQCDSLDGLADGMVDNFPACNFDPAPLTCSGAKTATCLTGAQVTGIKKVFAGAKNSAGEQLYAPWRWDVGISDPGWRVWKLGFGVGNVNDSLTATFGGARALPYVFTTPPTRTPDYLGFLRNFNFDTDAGKVSATSGIYTTSAVDFMVPTTNMTPFIGAKHKLMIYQGVSDPILSIDDTIDWYNKVLGANGGVAAQESVRLFPVPGMLHCGGGPATSAFDMLASVVDWVENGKAPDRIVATAPASVSAPIPPGRTRPLCPYPKQSRYNGAGSIDDAANFSCR